MDLSVPTLPAMEWRASQGILENAPYKTAMPMLGLISDVISLRSFSSLWYWLVVAAFWAQAARHVIGVPFDMVTRARQGGAPLAQIEAMAQLHAQRWLGYWQRAQVLLVAFWSVLLGVATALAFAYDIELAQAAWFLLVPQALLLAVGLRAAHRILGGEGHGAALLNLMYRTRFHAVLIGFMFVIATMFHAFVHLLVNGYFR